MHVLEDGVIADGVCDRRLYQNARNERGAKDVWNRLLAQGKVVPFGKRRFRILSTEIEVERTVRERHRRSRARIIHSPTRRLGAVRRNSEVHHGLELGGYRFLQCLREHPRKTVRRATVHRWFKAASGVTKKDRVLYVNRCKAGKFKRILGR